MADKVSIEESVLKSGYFEHISMPDWEKLWRYNRLEDAEFAALQSKLFQEFSLNTVDDKYVIVQLTGIFLRHVEARLLDSSVSDVIAFGKRNLEFCQSKGGLKLLHTFEDYPSNSSSGLQYQSLDMPVFLDFLTYARELSLSHQLESTQHDARKLLSILKRSILEFKILVILSNEGESSYFNVAILQHIPVQDFVDVYFSLVTQDKIELGHILEKRYQFADYNKFLVQELEWIYEIIEWGRSTHLDGTRSLGRYFFEENFLPMAERAAKKLLIAKSLTEINH